MVEHEEHWKAVVGYEGRYEVSDLGHVRRVGGKQLATPLDTGGYPYVFIGAVRGGPRKTHRVHNLVMEAFVGPCPEGLEVRHLDGDSARSILTNLAYGTHAENIDDLVAHGKHGRASVTSCPQGHPYTEDNTRLTRQGWRVCRTCARSRRPVTA